MAQGMKGMKAGCVARKVFFTQYIPQNIQPIDLGDTYMHARIVRSTISWSLSKGKTSYLLGCHSPLCLWLAEPPCSYGLCPDGTCLDPFNDRWHPLGIPSHCNESPAPLDLVSYTHGLLNNLFSMLSNVSCSIGHPYTVLLIVNPRVIRINRTMRGSKE
jgi:hypothetical protein